MTDNRVFPVFISEVGWEGRGGGKTVRGLWANDGMEEVPSRNRRRSQTAHVLIALPGTNRSIPLKYLWSAAAK